MRFVIYGAGAVGGVVGGRLFQAGHEVVLIARGRHLAAIQQRGLTLESPVASQTLAIPAVGAPSEIAFRPGDLVLFAMKTNDTQAAVGELVAAAGPDIPIACLQNGVES
jgi:2-dehydropantoate 2-reductase